jgi:site-specific DNA-methyltransferase (adenine-specific)
MNSVTNIDISKIKPYEKNPRKNDNAIDKVANSIKEFGFKQPIVVDKDYTIIAGHTRYQGANKLQLKEVPIIVADDLTPEQVKAYRIADNRVAQESEWDYDLLKIEFEELQEIDYNLLETGFDQKELDEMLQLEVEGLTDEDEVPEPPVDTVTKLGDIWQLGNHRLMCGDSRIEQNVDKLMLDKKINMVLTDPPFGVDYNEKNKDLNERLGGDRITEYIEADNTIDFEEFSNGFIKNFRLTSYNTIYIWINGKNAYKLYNAMLKNNIYVASQLIWLKNNHVLTRQDYSSKYEICFYGWKNKHKYYGDFSHDVLEYDRPNKNKLHPTMKPVKMLEKLVKDGSRENNIIYDCFLGSGSTLIACEKLNRSCFGFELNPIYCDVIIKRWESFTGKKAELIQGDNNG